MTSSEYQKASIKRFLGCVILSLGSCPHCNKNLLTGATAMIKAKIFFYFILYFEASNTQRKGGHDHKMISRN